MKRLAEAAGEAAAKAERHRQWSWCRRENGFSDMPLWRVVARQAGLQLCQVLAFVNRLEELANKTVPRGYVGDFSAAEFAAALDLTLEESERLYAALETPAIGWIVQEHVQTFYPRNPDKEDLGAAERKRAERARKTAMKALADRARRGQITGEERTLREGAVLLAKTEEAARLGLSTPLIHMSQCHNVTPCDIVTVTPRAEQDQDQNLRAVDNSGEAGRSESARLSEDSARESDSDPQAAAEQWLASEGARIVTERMEIPRTLAETRIARWRDQQLDGNARALVDVLQAVDKSDYVGARFHNLVVDGIRQARSRPTPQLPLPPPRPGLKVRHG